MSFAARCWRWGGANLVPLVLLPLALVLLWAALWRIWLPPADGSGAVTRTVTTVDSNAPSKPTHRVTSVVRTALPAVPSRRSEVLALALVLLAAGAAIVAVFHDRIGSIQLGKDGVKIDLTSAEGAGASALVTQLAARGAAPPAYAKAVDRYLRAVAAHRSAGSETLAAAAPLSAEEAKKLARRIVETG